jgi:predicted amidohydrolase
MKVAAAAYPLTDRIESWDAWEAKLSRWIGAVKADLLVFPEYGAMELALLAGEETARDPRRSVTAVARLMPQADEIVAGLARRSGRHILAASGPAATPQGLVNRARLFAPSGQSAFQDKQILTPWEREWLGMIPGAPLRVIETALGAFGILVCYDAEFPLLARALTDAGAEVLLVPACTDGIAGYTRVAIGARARALENQCFAVHAATLGTGIDWCPVIDENHGAAAVYGPPDPITGATGILAEGALGRSGWITARLDLAAASEARARGETRNRAHWSEQRARVRAVSKSRLG